MPQTKMCVSDEQLRNYLVGKVDRSMAANIELHLQSCGHCQSQLELAAGSPNWWNEAQSLLADYQTSSDLATSAGLTDGSSNKRLSGIDSHLSHWIGPTDDPTKMGRIGPYEVIGIIGYGGAGVVLRAHDNRLNRPVAIKALLPALAHNPLARRRFERESRAVAAITHQNVVPIYAVDTYNDHPYIAMYYVGGRSLQQRLDQAGPLQVTEIVRIASQIAQALAAAHAQGVIHRDIKPANILLESNVDRVFVTDFGLARVADDASTHSGMVTGTPQYMSPEQCHGRKVDHRTDLFSLGSVMYAMCTGRPPFRSDTLMGMLRKVCDTTPRSVREQNPEIPEWLESFVSRLLSKEPDDRFRSAANVAELLERELAHLNSPTTTPLPGRLWMADMVPASHPTAGNVSPLGGSDSTSEQVQTQPISLPFLSTISNFTRNSLMIASTTILCAAMLFGVLQNGNDGTKANRATADSNEEISLTITRDENGKDVYESVVERNFNAKESGKFVIVSDDADIRVEGAEIKQVRIRATRRVTNAASEALAKKSLANHDYSFKSEKDSIIVMDRIKDDDNDNNDDDKDESSQVQMQVHYVITVPSSFDVASTVNDGDLALSKVHGNATLKTKDGDIELDSLQGELTAMVKDGDITVRNCSGTMTLNVNDGDVELKECNGTVAATTKDGDIRLKNCRGNFVASTQDGTVESQNFDGNLITTPSAGSSSSKSLHSSRSRGSASSSSASRVVQSRADDRNQSDNEDEDEQSSDVGNKEDEQQNDVNDEEFEQGEDDHESVDSDDLEENVGNDKDDQEGEEDEDADEDDDDEEGDEDEEGDDEEDDDEEGDDEEGDEDDNDVA